MSDAESSQGAIIKVPLLPLRDIIVFPNMVVPLFVGRDKSIQALKEAMAQDKRVVLCAQKRAKTNEPEPEDLFEIGTLGTIRQLIQLPDGTVKVLVMGEQRVCVQRYLPQEQYFLVEALLVEDEGPMSEAVAELVRSVRETFDAYVKLNRRIPPELLNQVAKIEPPSMLADTIVAQMALKLADKQKILETFDAAQRLQRLLELMQEEIEILQVEKKIRSRVKKQMEKTQKDFYIEDGQPPKDAGADPNEFKNEIEELEARIQDKAMSEEAHHKLERELKKLKMMSPMSAEATVVRNYIDWVISLPWEERSQDRIDLEDAHATLERDHYGLKKPKARILEYLAVRALVDSPRGPILCLVGPPGVGKTSLGRSIAQTLGRRFVRLSLGGVRDEAEIRGHRRTYIGAMPGKIIHAMRKAETNNPVFLLDEIDKMSMDFRGDPSSALLEVLDPEQNATFNDHYLDMDYDLSQVMFICTANDLSGIPAPLRDRMEIIQLPGYTDHEKLQIARHYLVDKQIEANGLEEIEVDFSNSALRRIIDGYTREAGVRSLEREIGSVCRKIACKVVKRQKALESPDAIERVDEAPAYKVKGKSIEKYLGPEYYSHTNADKEDQIGVTHGLAWTQLGGVLLINEVAVLEGTGKFTITGKLGDVMQESAKAAMSYVRSRAQALGLSSDFHQKIDIHVHFPEGALPKDGPSAGITMATSIVSCLTRWPVRHDVAMTGEITLRGRILPIGGLKEKLLAAHRAGIRTVLIPKENAKDLRDLPRAVRDALEVIPVHHMDEVLVHALVHEDSEALRERLKSPALPPELWAKAQPLAEGAQEVTPEADAALRSDR